MKSALRQYFIDNIVVTSSSHSGISPAVKSAPYTSRQEAVLAETTVHTSVNQSFLYWLLCIFFVVVGFAAVYNIFHLLELIIKRRKLLQRHIEEGKRSKSTKAKANHTLHNLQTPTRNSWSRSKNGILRLPVIVEGRELSHFPNIPTLSSSGGSGTEEMTDFSEEPSKNILLTGFEVFGKHTVNASWEAVKKLSSHNRLLNFNIHCRLLPVDYRRIQPTLFALYEEIQPDIVVHCGVGKDNTINLEAFGRNNGYVKEDNRNYAPPSGVCIEKEDGKPAPPDAIPTAIDLQRLEGRIRAGIPFVPGDKEQCEEACDIVAPGPIECNISEDAGRYLCDFTYYTSLYHGRYGILYEQQKRKRSNTKKCEDKGCRTLENDCVVPALFVHVPSIGKPYSLKTLSNSLVKVLMTLIEESK
eukprot:Nk52_evm3s158 gene=Nk52_evmTU3s158